MDLITIFFFVPTKLPHPLPGPEEVIGKYSPFFLSPFNISFQLLFKIFTYIFLLLNLRHNLQITLLESELLHAISSSFSLMECIYIEYSVDATSKKNPSYF